jgi:hypothetical protein
MRSPNRIRDMLKNLRNMQGDQQYQEAIYPISDAIAALEWALGRKQVLKIGSCTCRMIADLDQADEYFNSGKGAKHV